MIGKIGMDIFCRFVLLYENRVYRVEKFAGIIGATHQ
jgi:hypothetical protein